MSEGYNNNHDFVHDFLDVVKESDPVVRARKDQEFYKRRITWDTMQLYETTGPSSFVGSLARADYRSRREQLHAAIVEDLLASLFEGESNE